MKEVLDLLEQSKLKGGITIEATDEEISYCTESYCTSTDETPVFVCEPMITVSRLD